ncbi:MAG: peptidylprolyl isomerase [Acholeplasmataceae bacterium]|nr:peptidylprolyl isomerase [Acholeplasmataceae bacterium]
MNIHERHNEKNPIMTIDVAQFGIMTFELFPEVAPNTVNNMVHLIKQHYYDGLVFHRIIEGFMIQGGWGKQTLTPIKGEFEANGFNNSLLHQRGVISMARTSDPNSQTSQFFIMHRDAAHLDGQYASFGCLLTGFDVLDQIAVIQKDVSDRPIRDIIIQSMHVETNGIQYPEPIYYYRQRGV